jgi:hypothetical protein
MPKKDLPRHRKDYVWAHPYGHGPFSPVLYADGGAGDGGGSGSSSSGTGGDGGAGAGGDGGQGGAGAGDGGGTAGGSATDWEAKYKEVLGHSRDWEKRAKDNKTAADELATLKASQMSDQEKAVADAEAKGRTAAVSEYGKELAAARFEVAATKAGVQLGEAAALIDMAQFVGDDGKPDTKAIDAAVKQLSNLAPAGGPGRSGGDFGGGSGDQATSLDKQIEEATAKRDFQTVIRLKRQKAAQTT